MSTLMADLRLAARGLRRSPLFATVAILSLALGIGANTAIFTLIDQILLRRLPVKDPDQLVMLYQQGLHMGSNMGSRMHSYPIYQDFQTRAETLSEVLCRRLVPASLSIDNRTERVQAEDVPIGSGPEEYFRELALPVLVLSVQLVAGWSRYQRSALLGEPLVAQSASLVARRVEESQGS